MTTVRCIRRKSVKGKERMVHKVKQHHAHHDGAWPFSAKVGDALRASVTVPDVDSMRDAFERVSARFRIVRIKNKFRAARDELAVGPDGEVLPKLKAHVKHLTFPDIHVNVLYQADGCAAIVAEVQFHLQPVQALMKHDHNLYEVIRAAKGRGVVELLEQAAERKRTKAYWSNLAKANRAERARLAQQQQAPSEQQQGGHHELQQKLSLPSARAGPVPLPPTTQ